MLAMFLMSCAGSGANQPPIKPDASLNGIITFDPDVPLGNPPGHQAPDIRYAARIIDPGDDIGIMPVPKPTIISSSGKYEFATLKAKPLVYLNLLFTVDSDLPGDGESDTTPVSLNIPVSLADGVSSLVSATIDKPYPSVLEMTYTYSGPDGTRVVRLREDYATNLLSIDLNSDGVFDDLVAVDADHDAIPDTLAPVIPTVDYRHSFQSSGPAVSLGSNTVTLGGKTFEITALTNISNAATGVPLSLSELSVGGMATINSVSSGDSNIALKLAIRPNAENPQLGFAVQREGTIEQIGGNSLTIAGTLFNGYDKANIVNMLGDPIPQSELKVGVYATVTGSRDGNVISANTIKVQEVAPSQAPFERTGTIQSLDPSDNPTSMSLSGITYKLLDTTEIEDINGQVLDRTYLHIGIPDLGARSSNRLGFHRQHNPIAVPGEQGRDEADAGCCALRQSVGAARHARLRLLRSIRQSRSRRY